MAQLITVRLQRGDGSPWGFRLQGGKDFAAPLVIQKVNGGSPAEKAGLVAGDSVIKVNTTDVYNLRHKDAQDVIVRAGQSFELTVQRGGSTWKPAVTPVGNVSRNAPVANNVSPVTKTSLAAKPTNYSPIGAAHNMSPKGFNQPHLNGDGPKLVNKQYNSPMALYSEDSIAETLSAQAEVLSTGALGVNFKKNEKHYNAEKSEVLKMLKEAENEPRSPEPAPENHHQPTSPIPSSNTTTNSSVVAPPAAVAPPTPSGNMAGLRHVTAPETKPGPTTPQLPPGQNICADCERLIVGVFVRIKDKNLHVECFKCATCGQSLKNVGYYNINNKLYCDIHAKLAARSNPPAPNMVPVTVPPGGKVPAGTISAALASHTLPSPSPLSPSGNPLPAPFQPPKFVDTVDRYSPNNTLKREDAVVNLMSALTFASQKEFKENGTNTDSVYLTEKLIPINNGDTHNDQYPSAKVKYMPYRPKTGTSLTGPKPFSSVQPSTPVTPVAAPLSNTLPRTGPSSAVTMPGRISTVNKPTVPAPAFKERKEWPPIRPDHEIPTASPSYIAPSSRNPTPCQIVIEQASNDMPNLATDNIKITKFDDHPFSVDTKTIDFSTLQKAPSEISIDTFESQSISEYQHCSEVYQHDTESYQDIQSAMAVHSAPKMSICSSEVFNITGRRSAADCVDIISDSLETQMLVNALTKERPKSPPPLQRKDSVLDAPPETMSIVISQNPSDFLPIEETCRNNCNPNVCAPKPCANICPMQNPNCPQLENAEYSQNQYSANFTKTTESSKLINSVPQEYISPMVKALTVASDRPFNAVTFTIDSKEFTANQPKETQNTQVTVQTKKSEMEFPHTQAPSSVTRLASALTIAPATPFAPSPQITLEPVPLPEETVPYIPPEIPITIEPKIETRDSCNSPFVQALTTAPDKPYKAARAKKQEIPDFMKEVPPPPKEKISMLAALTTATDRPFTPALSIISDTLDIQQEFMSPEPPKSTPKKIEVSSIGAKPASHIIPCPSAFKPFKPPLAYNPQSQEIPQSNSYPQTFNETTNNNHHSSTNNNFNYSTPSKLQTNKQVVSQKGMTQTSFIAQNESHNLTQQQKVIQSRTSAGLHAPTTIPVYQKHLKQVVEEQMHRVQPIQKPIQTLRPGQYNPNSSHTSFQPVVDEQDSHHLRISSPLPRPISPSMINKPAATIPYYQEDLIAHECPPVETNIFDPASPAVSRSPSPMPGARSTSPFPRHMTKSPAQGPPPNPLQDRTPKQVVRDERLIEAKQNLSTIIPKRQGRVEQIKQNLTMEQTNQSQVRMQSQQAYTAKPAQMTQQSQRYQNIQVAQNNIQQISPGYKMTQNEQMKHMEQLNNTQMQSIETSADNRVQIQRTKKVTEEYERTQKSKTIEIQTGGQQHILQGPQTAQLMCTSGSYGQNIQSNICGQRSQYAEKCSKMDQATTQNISKCYGQAAQQSTQFGQNTQNVSQATASTYGQSANLSSAFRQTIPSHQTNPKGFKKPVIAAQPDHSQPRSLSFPGSTAPIPKQYKSSPLAVKTTQPSAVSQSASTKPNVPQSLTGPGTDASGVKGRQSGGISVAPKRGRGVLNLAAQPGSRVPCCAHCNTHIRGPFITALGKIWCPEHFICTTPSCKRPLQDMGFVEERGQLYCEFCFEQYLAPVCSKCNTKIKGDCLNAIGKHFHPECFSCAYCNKLFGNSPFFLEDGLPYCEADWNELFTTKCFACGFPVEAGDRWVEALNNNYHSQCFNCTMCKKNLEGQSFFAKGGRPFCKNHAR